MRRRSTGENANPSRKRAIFSPRALQRHRREQSTSRVRRYPEGPRRVSRTLTLAVGGFSFLQRVKVALHQQSLHEAVFEGVGLTTAG